MAGGGSGTSFGSCSERSLVAAEVAGGGSETSFGSSSPRLGASPLTDAALELTERFGSCSERSLGASLLTDADIELTSLLADTIDADLEVTERFKGPSPSCSGAGLAASCAAAGLGGASANWRLVRLARAVSVACKSSAVMRGSIVGCISSIGPFSFLFFSFALHLHFALALCTLLLGEFFFNFVYIPFCF